jgi:hypothetical protein
MKKSRAHPFLQINGIVDGFLEDISDAENHPDLFKQAYDLWVRLSVSDSNVNSVKF